MIDLGRKSHDARKNLSELKEKVKELEDRFETYCEHYLEAGIIDGNPASLFS